MEIQEILTNIKGMSVARTIALLLFKKKKNLLYPLKLVSTTSE